MALLNEHSDRRNDDMPKYRVSAKVIGSKFIGVFEAKSKKEAEKMVNESDEIWVKLCHQCSDECEDPQIDELYIVEDE